jgi:hypothetical protein
MRRSTLVLLSLFLFAAGLRAEERVDYLRDIKPILKARCYACHGVLKQRSGLRLDTADLLKQGGDTGPVVVPGKADESMLILRVTASDRRRRMPPKGEPLTAKQINSIRAWIEQGAPSPVAEKPEEDPTRHWAFQPPVRTTPPSVKDPSQVGNAIDAFLAAKRDAKGLTPLPAASRAVLLRRVYLDLVGVPPTREELHAFLADSSPDAYARVVDRLLASPAYGERWGRHWMDVWRYSDWYGLGAQLRYSQKHIWHWRDWIIESLNEDKGYDRMVLEMLAADEVAPTDHHALRATGFLARNYFLFNRTTWLDNTIEHTSKAFLGLTMQCAKCHDHKYDPITQVDYYRFRAIFEPHQVRLDALPGEIDLERDGLPRVFDAHPEVPTYLFVRGNPKDPDTSKVIAPDVPRFLLREGLDITPVSLPAEAHDPALQAFVLADHLRQAEREITAARQALTRAQEQLARAEQREREQAAPDPKETTEPSGQVFLADDFAKERPDLWEMGPGEWTYKDGQLLQTKTGADRAYLRSRENHPADFEARFRFRTTGGMKWKSVGLCFDVAEGREKLVYLSAVSPGSKLQIAYKVGANHVYPPGAMQARGVQLNTPYELTIRVRGTLVNVAVNGQHALAYQLPVKRETGKVDLIAFDAATEFDAVSIQELPAGVKLVQAGMPQLPRTQPLTRAQAEAAVKAAEKGLQAAQLQPAMLQAVHRAQRARQENKVAGEATRLAGEAALAEARYQLAQAEAYVLRLQHQMASSGDQGKLAKALTQAKAGLEKAKQRLAKPGKTYTPLRASLKALEGPAENTASRNQPYPKESTGRRTALARWIIDRNNPLSARVAVNHLWLRHFGKPLVEPVTDLGRRTPEPLHRDLLDYLAVEFMESGWRMKALHRLIVTSNAYRLSGESGNADPETRKKDPNNHYYWRRDPVRMESEVVRDSLLHLAGALRQQLGGPTLDPKKADTAYRRSLYFAHSRDDVHPFLTQFDDANIMDCYRRSESIVPQQALTLANSQLSLAMARELGARLHAQVGSEANDSFIDLAWETILGTTPTPEERTACREALEQMQAALAERKHPDPTLRARQNLVHALFNHNDFITIR